MHIKKCFPLWYKDLSKQSWYFWCNSSTPSPSQFSCQHLEQRLFPLLMMYKTRACMRSHYWSFLWAVWSLETEWIKAPMGCTRCGHMLSFAAGFLSVVEQTPFPCMSPFLMEPASFTGCFEVQLLRREFGKKTILFRSCWECPLLSFLATWNSESQNHWIIDLQSHRNIE